MKQRMRVFSRKKCFLVLLGAFLGILSFFIIYGFRLLPVTNDGWIFLGWDEWDVLSTYDGWVNFRNSSWSIPLAQADAWAYPAENGLNITFADSIPSVSVLFKCLSPILPEPFQFMGIFTLAMYALQGIAASLLLSLFLENKLQLSMGVCLFTFSPILMERAFRHIALSSHCFILFSLYYYFRDRKTNRLPFAMLPLAALSVGVTPYFLPMVMIFVLLLAIESKSRLFQRGLYFVGTAIISLGNAVLLGCLSSGYSASRTGYGIYSMNMNALINPRSCGKYQWSTIFPQRPQVLGHYDGFNYLGAGVIIFLGLGILCYFVLLFTMSKKNTTPLKKWFLRNRWLLAVCLFLSLFAVSHSVYFDDIDLIYFCYPQWILRLCGIFRASSRLFYPVYYVLILFVLVLWKQNIARLQKVVKWNNRLSQILPTLFVSLICLTQALDLRAVICQKHEKANCLGSISYETIVPTALQDLTAYSKLFHTSIGRSRFIGALAAKNGLTNNCVDTNTWNNELDICKSYTEAEKQKIDMGQIEFDTVYTTFDKNEYELWQTLYGEVATFGVWKKHIECVYWPDNIYFMLPIKEGEQG